MDIRIDEQEMFQIVTNLITPRTLFSPIAYFYPRTKHAVARMTRCRDRSFQTLSSVGRQYIHILMSCTSVCYASIWAPAQFGMWHSKLQGVWGTPPAGSRGGAPVGAWGTKLWDYFWHTVYKYAHQQAYSCCFQMSVTISLSYSSRSRELYSSSCQALPTNAGAVFGVSLQAVAKYVLSCSAQNYTVSEQKQAQV